MSTKPTQASGYEAEHTALAERVLLEVWSRLGDYREHLVLIGGLAPQYIVTQRDDIEDHAGTMDVDLGISLTVAEKETYSTIRRTLISRMGFSPDTNENGNERRHSFIKRINGINVTIDFLTTIYGGPDSKIREVARSLSAVQVEGLGLALVDPLEVNITGKLLSEAMTEQTISVCRPIPYIVLKALSLENRGEPKDAYDLIYVMKNAMDSPSDLANTVLQEEHEAPAFQNAIEQLRNHFRAPEWDGPQKYSTFVDKPERAAEAFATVQEFLENLKE